MHSPSSSTYQSMCELQCQEGFNGTGDPPYVCDVLNNESSVMWMAEEETWRCEKGTYDHKYSSFHNHLCACICYTVCSVIYLSLNR